MHTFARKPKAPEPAVSGKSAAPDQSHFGHSHKVSSMLHLQRTIGNQAVQRQPAPAPPAPAPPPLFYDRNVRRPGALLDPAMTKDEITRQLTERVRAGHLSRFAVKGVPSGSQAEIFLLAEIFSTAKRSDWGTEADFVAPIGWPAKAGDPVPQGQVTLQIDHQGAATAELVARGAVPAPAQMTIADGSAKLVADFGFSSVTGWPDNTPAAVAKSAAEISDAIGAFELLKRRAPQDIPALKGLTLTRVASLGGNTAGEFSLKDRTLKLADLAFFANPFQFFGGGPSSPPVPASFQTILHEVGHAVEAENLRLAQEGQDRAQADLNAVDKRIKDESDTYDAEFAEAKRKGKVKQFYKKREASYKQSQQDRDAASARVRAEDIKVDDAKVTAATVQPFKDRATATSAAAASSLAAAKSAVQALLPDEVQSSAAWLQAVEAAAAAITSFPLDAQNGRGTIDDAENAVLQKVADRDNARKLLRTQTATHKAIPLLDPAAQAQDAWFAAERAYVRARHRTRRVQKFIDLVNANNIKRFTKYSVDNWLLKPGEFYAEAYSLWLTDPNFVKTNYPVVFGFFENGDYRR